MKEHRLQRNRDKLDNTLRYLRQPILLWHKWKAERAAARIMALPEIHDLQAIEAAWPESRDSFSASRYKQVRRYLPMNLRRIYLLGLDRKPGRKVLDLGAGAGHFLFLGRHFGNSMLGLDIDAEDFYRAMHQALKVECLPYGIYPQTPLPDFGRKFDLITSFAVCFHRMGEKRWNAEDWRFFLNDLLENHCAYKAAIYLHLNDDPFGDRDEVCALIQQNFPQARRGFHSITLVKERA